MQFLAEKKAGMSATTCNCIVLGGGSGGMGAARRAARYTNDVVLVEKQIRLGGNNCLELG